MQQAFALTLLSLLTAPALADPAFVSVAGSRFVLDGRPFVFAGANVDPLHCTRSRERLTSTLDAVRADGLTVIRVWALGEGPADASDWARGQGLFRAGPDGYIEDTYVALDELIAEAGARGLKVMLTLVNAWPDFGGVPQYLAWAGLPTKGPGAYDRFYEDPGVRRAVLDHVERLVDRRNTISGRRYGEDPTVFAWELMNESQVDSDAGATARLELIRSLGAFIHERARQLVTSGVVGYGTRVERARWLSACALPEVDFCDSHLYPQTSDRVDDRRALEDRVDDRVQLAHFVVKKPIVFGELGFDTRPEHDGWLGWPRARSFAHLFSRLARDRVDGALVWIYQPWTGKARDFGIYVDRDDTDDVRGTLRRFARAIATRERLPKNPRLGEARGSQPLYPVYRTLRKKGRASGTEDEAGTTITLSAEGFSLARWERLGTWDGGELAHAYGAPDGFFEWRFSGPRHPVKRAVLRARLSSELPGVEAPPEAGSTARVLLDGRPLGELEVMADDGRGAFVELVVEDPAKLAHLGPGPHRLRLAIEPGPRANGLCVYGATTAKSPPELEPGVVSLRLLR